MLAAVLTRRARDDQLSYHYRFVDARDFLTVKTDEDRELVVVHHESDAKVCVFLDATLIDTRLAIAGVRKTRGRTVAVLGSYSSQPPDTRVLVCSGQLVRYRKFPPLSRWYVSLCRWLVSRPTGASCGADYPLDDCYRTTPRTR